MNEAQLLPRQTR